jgi:hypothetical protein
LELVITRTVMTLMLIAAASVPFGCAANAVSITLATKRVASPLTALPVAAVQVARDIGVMVRMPAAFRAKSIVGYTAASVNGVVLRLYAKNAAHATFDYEGAGAVLFTSSGYTWASGVDSSGNHQYTISYIPASATDYVVTAHAFQGATDLTKVVGGFGYARSSNSVLMAALSSTYSDSGAALLVNVPLLDGSGNSVDATASVAAGVEPAPAGGNGL